MTRFLILLSLVLACLSVPLTASSAGAENPTGEIAASAPNLFGTIDPATGVGTVDMLDASGAVFGTVNFTIDPATKVLTGTANVTGSGFTPHVRGRQNRPGKFYAYVIYLSPFHFYYIEGKWDAAGNIVGGWM